MSHFTTIKTKIKERPYLIGALKELDYSVLENHLLINPEDHDHNQWNLQVAINDFVGFKWILVDFCGFVQALLLVLRRPFGETLPRNPTLWILVEIVG